MIKLVVKTNVDEFFAGSSEENFSVGPEATCEDAAAEYFAENEDDESCYVGKGQLTGFEVSGRRLMEWIGEGLADELYEDALDSWCEKMPKEAYDELSQNVTGVVRDWLKKHGQQMEWNVIGDAVLVEKAAP